MTNAASNGIRDWWRGYSESDVASLVAKLKEPSYPGAIIHITNREMRALRDPRTWGAPHSATGQ